MSRLVPLHTLKMSRSFAEAMGCVPFKGHKLDPMQRVIPTQIGDELWLWPFVDSAQISLWDVAHNSSVKDLFSELRQLRTRSL